MAEKKGILSHIDGGEDDRRTILHVDMNSFYASVEMLYDPSLKNIPMAVGGDKETRHGIILTKNIQAKAAGVSTGEALWQARQKCPNLEIVPAHYERYRKYSKLAREIYYQYTDQVEPFGMDECWLDVSGSVGIFGDGETIAQEIRQRIKDELGLTVSVGVSWNKIFAKLGSDYKKPDAVTVISRENYRKIAWELPAGDLLMVGRATQYKLTKYGINTIGQLANTDTEFLHRIFGKMGYVLHAFANGRDSSPVAVSTHESEIKSVGNSATTPVDISEDEDIKTTMYILSESVAERLRESSLAAGGIQISLRSADMEGFGHQCRTAYPVSDSESIFRYAFRLYRELGIRRPLRNIGVRATDLSEDICDQVSLYEDVQRSRRWSELERTVDGIRNRYGRDMLVRGLLIAKPKLAAINPHEDHFVHPVGYFKD